MPEPGVGQLVAADAGTMKFSGDFLTGGILEKGKESLPIKIFIQLFHKLRRDLLREGEGREVSKAVGDVAEEHGAAF